jgi:hypothetical protein
VHGAANQALRRRSHPHTARNHRIGRAPSTQLREEEAPCRTRRANQLLELGQEPAQLDIPAEAALTAPPTTSILSLSTNCLLDRKQDMDLLSPLRSYFSSPPNRDTAERFPCSHPCQIITVMPMIFGMALLRSLHQDRRPITRSSSTRQLGWPGSILTLNSLAIHSSISRGPDAEACICRRVRASFHQICHSMSS